MTTGAPSRSAASLRLALFMPIAASVSFFSMFGEFLWWSLGRAGSEVLLTSAPALLCVLALAIFMVLVSMPRAAPLAALEFRASRWTRAAAGATLLVGMLALGVMLVGPQLGGDRYRGRLTELSVALWRATWLLWLATAGTLTDVSRPRRRLRVFGPLYLSGAAVVPLAGVVKAVLTPLWGGAPTLGVLDWTWIGLVFLGFIGVIRERPLKKGCCHVCDYDLTGNVSGRCPECGAPVAGEAVEQEARAT